MKLDPTFLDAASTAGCLPDQAEHFLSAEIILQPRPLAASAAFNLMANHPRRANF